MAQFDLYARLGSRDVFVVDVQANLLEELSTCVVAPLLPRSRVRAEFVRNLTPTVDIEGEPYAVLVQELVTVSRRDLHAPAGSLAKYRDDIRRALDTLLVGF